MIIAKTDGRWIFCKHKERDIYEVPGGHREAGENLVDDWTYPLIQPKLIEEAKKRGVLLYSIDYGAV